MSPRAIIVWQPLLTDHMSATLAALGVAAGLPVIAYVTRLDDDIRAAQGWTIAPPVGVQVELLPETARWPAARTRLDQHAEDIHIFGSPFEERTLMQTLALALHRRLPTFLVSEPYPVTATAYFSQVMLRDRLKAVLRPLLYRGYGVILRGRISGVFAISQRAVTQFTAMGVAPDRIFPFGYFVAPGTSHRTASDLPGAPLRVAFIGTLIERKGLPELVEAARRLRGTVAIDVYGPGNPARFDFEAAGVRFCGRAEFGTAQAVFARYDLAVVPSRHDGWGVVVNEALQAGVPVLCSDATGAAAIVRRWGCGLVIPAGDAAALAEALATLAADRPRLAGMAAAAARVANLLTPDVAGSYVNDAITSVLHATPRPANPWYDAP